MTYAFVHGSIGEVHKALKVKLYSCIHLSNSLRGTLRHQEMCLESLSRCLVFLNPRERLYTEINMGLNQLCGGLNTGEHFQTSTWDISIHGRLGIYIVIHHFQLPVEEQKRYTLCRRASVHVEMKWSSIFCGHRAPWNMSSYRSSAEIKLFTIDKEQRGCYFVMSFEAFDRYSPSVTHVHQHFQLIQNHPLFQAHRARIHKTGIIQLIRHKNPHSLYRTEIQLHIMTYMFKQVAVRYSTRLADVQVHDGPGPLSPIVSTYANSTSFRTAILSSFQGYIIYLILLASKDMIYPKESELSWSSIDIAMSKYFKDCVQYPNVSTVFRTTSGYCHPQRFHSYITIHRLHFSGFDTLYTGGYHESCHYGGLFMVFYSGKTSTSDMHRKRTIRYFKLCSSITSEKTFPFMALKSRLSMLIMFKTYKGYSRGFVDITIPLEHDCYGQNFISSKLSEYGICSSNWYRQALMPWDDNMGDVGKNNRINHCVDFWLTHNIISYDPGRGTFLNCSLYLNNDGVVRMDLHGPVKLSISSSIMFPSLQYMDHNDTRYFMMKIVAGTLKDYPVNTDVVESDTSVDLLTPSIHMFNTISSINFTVMHRAHDAPIFAIRMQLLTNYVCGSVLHNNFSDFYSVYRLSNDITTVGLSAYFPHSKIFQLILNKTGHIHGPCRLYVEGQSCSRCRCKKLVINFRPRKGYIHYNIMIVTTHKIDVSIKAKGNLVGCVLDIGIWENFENVESRQHKTYYHEWNNVYRLTWYVISNRGYSLLVNTSCDQSTNCSLCSELCNIVVSIDVQQRNWLKRQDLQDIFLPTIDNKPYQEQLVDCLSNIETTCYIADSIMQANSFEPRWSAEPFRSSISLSKIVYGNWYEAQEFCSKRNSHLVTLDTMLPGKLKKVILKSTGFVHNLDKSNIHVFAGLYRSATVSIFLTVLSS